MSLDITVSLIEEVIRVVHFFIHNVLIHNTLQISLCQSRSPILSLSFSVCLILSVE